MPKGVCQDGGSDGDNGGEHAVLEVLFSYCVSHKAKDIVGFEE